MRLSLSLGGWFTSSKKMVEAAVLAESAGFDTLYAADSPMIYRDPFGTLALCAEATSRIRLGVAVSPVKIRHISVLANSILTLNEICGGRAILGLGSGDSGVKRLGEKPATLREFRQAVSLLRGLLGGHEVDFDGGDFSLRWAHGGPPIPIYIAATGPNTLRLAGEVSDGVIMLVGSFGACVSYSAEMVREGIRRAGRRDGEVKLSLLAFTFLSDDRGKALEAARPAALWFFRNAPNLVELAGGQARAEANALDYDKSDHIHSDRYEHDLGVPEYVTADLAGKFCLAGTSDDIVSTLEGLKKAGLDEVVIRHNSEEDSWMDFLRDFEKSVLSRM